MTEENINSIEQEEESSIDFAAIFGALKKHKRLYYKALPIAFIIACIYTLSLPNYYKCEVKLSPELSSNRSNTSSLLSMASAFGVNLGNGAAGMGTEALFPTLYPELMNSVDFKTSLFPVMIHRDKETEMMSYYNYLKDEQKAPWWSEAIGAVFKGIGSLLGGEKKPEKDTIDPFRLTKKQARVVKALDKKVVCDVDKKTMMITIDVTDQDPLICATIADTVMNRLQDFITDYRTKKARIDLEYSTKLYEEAKARYDKARQRYAAFADANNDLVLQSVQTQLANLENEMQLQYNIYQQVAAQMQQAEAKVQRETPAFTTIQRATVPVKKAGPGRAKMCLVFTFLVFIGVSVWILHKENQLKPLLGLG